MSNLTNGSIVVCQNQMPKTVKASELVETNQFGAFCCPLGS